MYHSKSSLYFNINIQFTCRVLFQLMALKSKREPIPQKWRPITEDQDIVQFVFTVTYPSICNILLHYKEIKDFGF